jgi:hypothetical protein
MTFELKTEQLEKFKKKVEKANELADKLNLNSKIEFEIVEKSRKVNEHWFWGGGYLEKYYIVTVTKNIDLTFARYEFVSLIEEEDGVFVSKTVPNKTIPTYYITDKSYHGCCDHCKQKRARKSTYIIFDKEENKFIQVGSSCINEFLVKDVERLVREVFYVFDTFSDFEDEPLFYRSKKEDCYPFINFLGVITTLTNFGENFVSITYANNHQVQSTVGTFKEILYYYSHRNEKSKSKGSFSQETIEKIEKMFKTIQPKEEHYAFAEKVIEWVGTLGTSKNEYLINLHQYFKAYKDNCVPDSKLGWVASAVSAYYKAHKEEKVAPETTSTKSEYVGAEGERVAVKGTIITMRFMTYDTQFQMLKKTYLFKVQDDNGNILVAFSQAKLEGLTEGDYVEVKATVKKHETFQNIKQTRITRITAKKIKKED